MRKSKILFIGLGRMGYHISKYLSLADNIDLYIYNRTKHKIKKWLKSNKAHEFKYQSLDLKFDFVITCVKDDKAIKEVLIKKSIFKFLNPHAIIIDHSTISIPQVKSLYNYFIKKKIYFFDSPITGGEEGAKKGKLSTMVGGNKTNYKKIINIISLYCRTHTYMGISSFGQLCKYSNQILICGILISISEAIKFNKINKINQKKFYSAVLDGAAGSWQLTNRFPTMVKNKFNFGFSTELMAKDLKYIISHSKKNNLDINLSKKALILYKKLSKSKYYNQDTSSIISLI